MSDNSPPFIVDFDWGAAERLKTGEAREATDVRGREASGQRRAGRLVAGAGA